MSAAHTPGLRLTLSADTHTLPDRPGIYRQIMDGEGMGSNILGFICVGHPANCDLRDHGAAWANRIVQRVNSHEGLVEALRRIEQRAFSDAPAEELEDVQRDLRHIHAIARAAIAAANGEAS